MTLNALGEPRSILLLGGTSEIGLAAVDALASPSLSTVVLAGRDTDRVRAAGKSLSSHRAEVAVERFDALETEAHGTFVDAVFDTYGDVDVALLAFGVLPDQDAAEEDPSIALETGRVNYLGVVSVGLHLAERMQAQGHGAIVVVSSVAAERARAANYVYGASKAGADAFAQGLGDRLAGTGVHVMVVRPGFVHTKMTAGLPPKPLSVGPEAVGQAIARGLQRGDHTVWAPSKLRFVMSGMRHLPRPLFRRIRS